MKTPTMVLFHSKIFNSFQFKFLNNLRQKMTKLMLDFTGSSSLDL